MTNMQAVWAAALQQQDVDAFIEYMTERAWTNELGAYWTGYKLFDAYCAISWDAHYALHYPE